MRQHRGHDAGTYEVLGLLGRGGMAEVYLALHRERGEQHALKVLHLPDSRLLERLARERRLQARVEHVNVLPVLGEVDFMGRPALVLPYVQGPSLERFSSEAILTRAQALGLFRGVVDGVAAIHAAGLVHRDLKPGNVLLDPASGAGVPRVSDFGLARALHGEARLTRTGIGLGTPLYAAPEQRRDAAHVDARADVWALGCLLVELLGGRSRDDGSLRQRIPSLPEPWAGLATVLLAEDPDARPADAAEVRRLLPPMDPGDPGVPAELCRQLAPAVLPVPANRLPLAEGTILPVLTPRPTTPLSMQPRPALPAERDAFVGREQDLLALQEVVSRGARLVTVLGTGGVGKTRLVLRWARSHVEDWPGGVWFCDLCEARSTDRIAAAVARSLEVRLEPPDPVRQLGHALAGRGDCLFILDNFEQVSQHAEEALGHWLERAEQARFVVTSRSVLGIAGEHTLSLPPMTPSDAEALFVRRAEAALPGFSPTVQDRISIGQLVELLDRLPLALELAAPRVRTLSPRDILDRMAERFTLLASPRARSDRHATLRATLDWSWELLSPPEQEALAQLSVFEGGFTQRAAEAVLVLPGPSETWAVLQALVDQSLVGVSVDRGRMDLLVSVREYAAEKLGPGTLKAERRHGLHFGPSLAARGGRAFRREARSLLPDLENMLAACRRAIARGDGDVASGALDSAWPAIGLRGPIAEGASLAEGVLRIDGLGAPERGLALAVAGEAAQQLGHLAEARRHLEEALAIARKRGDGELEQRVLTMLGVVSTHEGHLEEAGRWLDAAIGLARTTGARWDEGIALGNLGLMWSRKDQSRSADLYAAVLAISREVGDRRMETHVLLNIAGLWFAQNRDEECMAALQEALVLTRQVGDRVTEATCLLNIGILRQPVDEAIALLQPARVLAREIGNRRLEGRICAQMGDCELQLGRHDHAVGLLEVAAAIARELGQRLWECLALADLGVAYHRQGRQAEARACSAAIGILREREPDKNAAQALRKLATLQVCLGDPGGAAGLLDEAAALLRSGLTLRWPTFSPVQEFGLVLAARIELALQARDLETANHLLAEGSALPLRTGSRARTALDRVASLAPPTGLG